MSSDYKDDVDVTPPFLLLSTLRHTSSPMLQSLSAAVPPLLSSLLLLPLEVLLQQVMTAVHFLSDDALRPNANAMAPLNKYYIVLRHSWRLFYAARLFVKP